MKEYSLKLLETHEKINIYSILFKGEKLTELEKFLEKFPIGCKQTKDIDKIVAWLDKITETGACERYFRPEGRQGDGVSAIPIDVNGVRLYCIRITDQILIIGNGGLKAVRKWQDDPELSSFVRVLIATSAFIRQRASQSKLKIKGKNLTGNLKFTLHEEE